MASEALREEAERIIREDLVPDDALQELIEEHGDEIGDREVTVFFKADADGHIRESWEIEVPWTVAYGPRDELIEYVDENMGGATFLEQEIDGEDNRKLDPDTVEVR